MKTSLEMVREFHAAFAPEQTHERPHVADPALNNLRFRLINEEGVKELVEGLLMQDPLKVLDALCDLQYVLDGAFLALGFGDVKDAAMAEVHRANCDKMWTGFQVQDYGHGNGLTFHPIGHADLFIARDAGGKVVKPPGHQPPDLAQFLA